MDIPLHSPVLLVGQVEGGLHNHYCSCVWALASVSLEWSTEVSILWPTDIESTLWWHFVYAVAKQGLHSWAHSQWQKLLLCCSCVVAYDRSLQTRCMTGHYRPDIWQVTTDQIYDRSLQTRYMTGHYRPDTCIWQVATDQRLLQTRWDMTVLAWGLTVCPD